MERKTVKKGSIALYLALLLIAIIAMIALRNFDKIVSTPDKPQRDSMVVTIHLFRHSRRVQLRLVKNGGSKSWYQPKIPTNGYSYIVAQQAKKW